MFGGEDALIQVDMSEYMEKFAVSRMTGSPPGYVGHEEGGQLTEQVRQRPYSVVLFDEIEKAHPDVMDLLLQILEEGRLTDSFGRKIDFRNTIIIMTSNLGADLIKEIQKSALEPLKVHWIMIIKEKIEGEVKKRFKPEFLKIERYRHFPSSQPREPAASDRTGVEKGAEPSGRRREIFPNLDDLAKNFLVDKGFQPEMGARPLRRTIEQYLEDPLAELFCCILIWEGVVWPLCKMTRLC